jgi:hypothetical protein
MIMTLTLRTLWVVRESQRELSRLRLRITGNSHNNSVDFYICVYAIVIAGIHL